ncbi:hypothetical protein PENSUB_12331 [Penicillium subrubescens]|uniref:Uncharacterized protein n=1 Tax=Penicillium subrubescens TaxID=1316194 RepID=A0A1Q5SZ41_9EURO|nr:hypothetical protein PENSUB_12331 [Penicillium subrubescens]
MSGEADVEDEIVEDYTDKDYTDEEYIDDDESDEDHDEDHVMSLPETHHSENLAPPSNNNQAPPAQPSDTPPHPTPMAIIVFLRSATANRGGV